jgi:hypothetical protein
VDLGLKRKRFRLRLLPVPSVRQIRDLGLPSRSVRALNLAEYSSARGDLQV